MSEFSTNINEPEYGYNRLPKENPIPERILQDINISLEQIDENKIIPYEEILSRYQ